MLEAKVEEYLVSTTEARGGWCAKMRDLGRKGMTDRELRMPGGHIVFAETKKPKGSRYEAGQIRYHEKLRSLGFDVVTLYTHSQIDAFWRSYDGRTIQP
jgi:hypothetical protein